MNWIIVRYIAQPQTLNSWLSSSYRPQEFSQDRFGQSRPLPLGSPSLVPHPQPVFVDLPYPWGVVLQAEPATVADLRRAGIISSQKIVAAIDLYLRDPAAGPYQFANGCSLDVAALVSASPALEKVGRSRPLDARGRTALAASIMAAHPPPP